MLRGRWRVSSAPEAASKKSNTGQQRLFWHHLISVSLWIISFCFWKIKSTAPPCRYTPKDDHTTASPSLTASPGLPGPRDTQGAKAAFKRVLKNTSLPKPGFRELSICVFNRRGKGGVEKLKKPMDKAPTMNPLASSWGSNLYPVPWSSSFAGGNGHGGEGLVGKCSSSWTSMKTPLDVYLWEAWAMLTAWICGMWTSMEPCPQREHRGGQTHTNAVQLGLNEPLRKGLSGDRHRDGHCNSQCRVPLNSLLPVLETSHPTKMGHTPRCQIELA